MGEVTILALRVFGPELAVVWTDSQCLGLDDGRHSRMRNKLVVTGTAMAVVGGGWSALADVADRVVIASPDMDTAVRRLPEALRQGSMRAIRSFGRDPREVSRQVILLAGYSAAAARVMGFQFCGRWSYEPVIATAEAIPAVPAFAQLREPSPEQIERIARAQLEALRQDFPEATGGPLALATVHPHGIEVRSVCDLTPPQPQIQQEDTAQCSI